MIIINNNPSPRDSRSLPCDEKMARELERIHVSGVWYRATPVLTTSGKQGLASSVAASITFSSSDVCRGSPLSEPMFRMNIHGTKYTATWFDAHNIQLSTSSYAKMATT